MTITRYALITIALATATPAWAHKPSDAHLRLTADGTAITGRIDVAVRDLDAALGIDDDGNGEITWAELAPAAPRIASYIDQRLALTLPIDADPCPYKLGAGGLVDLSDGTYWSLQITATCPRVATALEIRYRLLFDIDSLHRGLAHVAGQTVILRDGNPVPVMIADPAADPATASTTTGPFAAFVREGVWHIWIGFDHILFLVCLILPAVFQRRAPAESFRDVGREVLATVTAFTLAHSITLVISATGLVALPSRFVETAIALSVVVAALNNLVRMIDARWAVAFALGLLHGFGFSSVLLDLGLPSDELISALLGFNLGVELGQLAIVAVLLPLLFWIRRTFAYRILLWAGSASIAGLASWWTYERLCG